MEPSDVTGPLADFQATKPTEDDLLKLLKTLNKALGESALKNEQLQAAFEIFWPKIEAKLANLPADGPSGRPHRTERELLEELVTLARSAPRDTVSLERMVFELSRISTRLANVESRQSSSFNAAELRMDEDFNFARHYAEAAEAAGSVLSGESSTARTTKARVPSLPIGLRAAGRRAGVKISNDVDTPKKT
jgi:hypothetical protein